ncbi:L,D-transpeptidase [Plantactinospora sp. GCM10030261]|uniref:L,D-transpeptidase n=1 Tax=Plantactinospora sp. GCM10030261 TaxID=3273420 RepID=UPI003608651A
MTVPSPPVPSPSAGSTPSADAPAPTRRWLPVGVVAGLVVLAMLVIVGLVVALSGDADRPPAPGAGAGEPMRASPAPSSVAPTTAAPLTAAPAPAFLKTIDYGPAPSGFPADPDPQSTVRPSEGLHPVDRTPVYDAPGGKPRAFLAPTISGVPLTMPIVERRSGWAAVLLPSANRTIGWVPPGDWETVPLRDLIVIERRSHRLIWLRDDKEMRSWRVTLGAPETPTPLGRSFVLGRSKLPGKVYANTDVFALGSLPENVDNLPTALRGAHIGIHAWHNDNSLGKYVSDGCIRLTRDAQRELLSEIAPGTTVVTVDR